MACSGRSAARSSGTRSSPLARQMPTTRRLAALDHMPRVHAPALPHARWQVPSVPPPPTPPPWVVATPACGGAAPRLVSTYVNIGIRTKLERCKHQRKMDRSDPPPPHPTLRHQTFLRLPPPPAAASAVARSSSSRLRFSMAALRALRCCGGRGRTGGGLSQHAVQEAESDKNRCVRSTSSLLPFP